MGSAERGVDMRPILLATLMVLIGCAEQPEPNAYDPPGFFMGIVHGLISPFSLIGSIFMDIRIYAFPNSEVFYDFGLMGGLFLFLIILLAILANDG